jgi:uncharacterized membrane protein YfcA
VGALWLLWTGEARFARIVPFLVLGATLLFMVQGPLLQRLPRLPVGGRFFFVAQFAVGVYGGYFGAGVGILMLATLELMGHRNIHRMNGLKNWGGLLMNLVAAGLFVGAGIVDWSFALPMALGGLLGGYLGSQLAQRVGQAAVRRFVVAVGFASFLWLLLRPL